MVEDITAEVNRLISESPKKPVRERREGEPFFTCKSVDKERPDIVFKSMCPYVGVKIR